MLSSPLTCQLTAEAGAAPACLHREDTEAAELERSLEISIVSLQH